MDPRDPKDPGATTGRCTSSSLLTCVGRNIFNRHMTHGILTAMSIVWSAIAKFQWRHNGRNGVSNHQPHNYLLNRLFKHRLKKTSKLRVTDLCEGNWPVTEELLTQRASNAEHVPIWWSHHDILSTNELMYGQKIIIQYTRDNWNYTL